MRLEPRSWSLRRTPSVRRTMLSRDLARRPLFAARECTSSNRIAHNARVYAHAESRHAMSRGGDVDDDDAAACARLLDRVQLKVKPQNVEPCCAHECCRELGGRRCLCGCATSIIAPMRRERKRARSSPVHRAIRATHLSRTCALHDNITRPRPSTLLALSCHGHLLLPRAG